MSLYVCTGQACTNPVEVQGDLCTNCQLLVQAAIREPSADIRQWAGLMREQFTALVNEGFTEAQALYMCGIAWSTAVQTGMIINETKEDRP